MWYDKQFVTAMSMAPLVLFFLWLFQRPQIGIIWPLKSPRTFLLLIVLYPILEEIVFRGLLQEVLYKRSFCRRKISGISMANLITSLLFMSSHYFYDVSIWASLILVPSLTFGYFRDKYQSVKPSIILHVFYNLCYYLVYKPVI